MLLDVNDITTPNAHCAATMLSLSHHGSMENFLGGQSNDYFVFYLIHLNRAARGTITTTPSVK